MSLDHKLKCTSTIHSSTYIHEDENARNRVYLLTIYRIVCRIQGFGFAIKQTIIKSKELIGLQ